MRSKKITIGNKIIGQGEPVFIIAEAGVNHNGSLEIAKKLIDAAVEAGADAFKTQTFTAEYLVTGTAKQADYQERNMGETISQLAMLKRLELSPEAHHELQKYCNERGIIFLSTPFSEPDSDFLQTLNLPAYKVSSGDLTTIPFLKHLAKKGKPIILSTGMADITETKESVQAILNEGNDQIIVLHSTSNYPPSFESLNLRAIQTLERELAEWNIPIGYSDNGSTGIVADIAAVAVGARVLEKHYTLDKTMDGPDHKASLDPVEFKAMVDAIRIVERTLGTGVKGCTPEEEPIRLIARKSVVAARDISLGKKIELADLMLKRPGTGIPAKKRDSIVGKIATTLISADTLINESDLK